MATLYSLWATILRPYDSIAVRVFDAALTLYLAWNVVRGYRFYQRAVQRNTIQD